MKQLNAFYILLAIIVYVIQRKQHKTNIDAANLKSTKDAVRDNINYTISDYIPRLLLCVPLYLIMTHQARLLEHVIVLYITFVAIRSTQIVINPTTRPVTEHTTPLMCLSMLLLVYHGIIHRSSLHFVYGFILLHSITALLVYSKKTSTSTLIDDLVLSHLLFYTFKS